MLRRPLKPPGPVKRTYTETVEALKYQPSKREGLSRQLFRVNQTVLFHAPKTVSLVYENALTAYAAGAVTGAIQTKPNSAFDYDNSSGAIFGNKQPLYYDSLLSASGPYRNYKVNSWKTTYTIINTGASPITVFAFPPISGTSEVDSLAEADNFPGVKRLYLTAATGSKNIGTLTVTGNIEDVYPSSGASEGGFIAAYNADPTYLCYSGLILSSGDGTTNVTAQIAVRHVMNTTLQAIDALVS